MKPPGHCRGGMSKAPLHQQLVLAALLKTGDGGQRQASRIWEYFLHKCVAFSHKTPFVDPEFFTNVCNTGGSQVKG